MERFWSKVNKTDSCWLWTAATTTDGYGKFQMNGRTYRAHRVAYALIHGIPAEELLLHSCDNRLCVNPAHLVEGSHKENMADMSRKGRGRNQYSSSTHCKRGHEFTDVNTRVRADGRRDCKECWKRSNRGK